MRTTLLSCLFFANIFVCTAQTSYVVSSNNVSNDTVNVERYDDQNLKKLVGSTVPYFHHTQRRFWYSWQEAGQAKSQLKVWDAKKGKYNIDSFNNFDSFKYPKIMPYGVSPDSLYCISDDATHNICVKDIKTGRTFSLSKDGEERHAFQIIDVKWMGSHFILPREDKRNVRQFHITYSLTQTPMDYAYDYEIPGDTAVSTLEFYVGDAATGSFRKVDIAKWSQQEVVLQKAEGVSDRIFFWRKKRTRDVAELCSIDTAGVLRVLITEEAKPRINPDMFWCSIENNGNDIFLWSDRTGWGHIYHYNREGKLINAVTSGSWTAGRIAAVDTKKHLIYFTAYGRENGRNPYYAFLYRVGFDGKGLRLLTPEDANHSTFVNVNLRLIVDTYSRIDLPPTVCVRDISGKVIEELEHTDVSKLHEYGWKEPEMFEVKAADGSTPLYGIMWKPYDFDAAKKYPVISQVYPGPFTETVWNDYTVFDRYHNAALAQRGFIVVVFGHRGSSPFRSKEYNTYGYGNLRDYPLADDKAGIEQLAKRFSFIDIGKVGIVGHSGGGMMAATAIMTYPEFYKAAVASSGNYDNTIYNRYWGENYQGIGEDGKFHVETVQELAKNLRGHLMLATGDADQNVHPAHTQRLVDALIKANKDFDLLILPGCGHHYDERDATYQKYFERRKRDFFEKWLK